MIHRGMGAGCRVTGSIVIYRGREKNMETTLGNAD